MILTTAMYQVTFFGNGFLPGLAADECGVLVNGSSISNFLMCLDQLPCFSRTILAPGDAFS